MVEFVNTVHGKLNILWKFKNRWINYDWTWKRSTGINHNALHKTIFYKQKCYDEYQYIFKFLYTIEIYLMCSTFYWIIIRRTHSEISSPGNISSAHWHLQQASCCSGRLASDLGQGAITRKFPLKIYLCIYKNLFKSNWQVNTNLVPWRIKI